ncbi:MAG: type IX secretion system sortase PorU [Prevotellaceae bacterium]|nr:type IX secretion system sortase PorU [Prevotellaceae bacterium]
MRRIAIYLMLLTAAGQCLAQGDFTTLDWQEMRIDSVLPVYSEVVPLESDYRLNDYTVSVQYPEWQELTAREAAVAERFDDEIGDTLRIQSHVTVSRKVGMLDINFRPLVRREGRYWKLLSGKIEITPVRKAQASRRRIAAAETAERYTRSSVLSEGKWAKISVEEEGVYRLTNSALKTMGFSDPLKVHLYGYGGHRLGEVSDPDNEYDDLREVPMLRSGDTWLFWADGLLYWDGDTRVFNPYANASCYFLTETTEDNTPPTEQSLTDAPLNVYSSYTAHTLYEKDEYSWFTGGRNLYESTNYAGTGSHTYKLSTPDALGDEKLKVVFTAGADTKTTVTPTVNGTDLTSFTISALSSYAYGASGERTYDVSALSTGTDWTIKLASTTGNDARLDYLSMSYTRSLAPEQGFVAFSQTGSGVTEFDIEGGESTKVMRIGTPTREGAVIEGKTNGGTTYTVTVDDPTERYVAFDTSYSFPEPKYVGSVDNQNLHALDSIDMVIIVPESGKLLSEAQRLAEAHERYDSLRVAVVRADQVYNEFSSGTPDATAYRRLMKMLYDRAESDEQAPRYLLLFGDCAWDNRMIGSSWQSRDPKDYLLCFESENSFSDVLCYVMEDYFGLLDDGEGSNLTSDKVDIGVGRFPVVSEAEAKVMVDKSIAFMSNSNAGNWKNIVMMIGDDGDENIHMRYADDVAERVIASNPEMEVRKLMLDAYTRQSSINHNTYPEVTALLKQQMQDGSLVMNYTGHAATYCLSHEFILQTEDFASTKSDYLPLWVTAACDVMPFDGLADNIGETAVLNDGGAAVAFYGTARTVYSSNNLQMNRWFMRYLFGTDAEGRRYRVGDAVRLAKTYLISGNLELTNKENKLHYALLGDPALTFGAPTNRVVLDSINGSPLDGSTQLSAGQLVRMTGHVENSLGELLTGFNGLLSARVYDNLETITCKNNAGASSAFSFTNRDKVLFNGQDSVASGRFTLSFVMPVDINFSDEAGRVVFYAINDDLSVEANGYSEDFTVGGVSDNDDTDGPLIYAYLNTDEFESGDKVNATPFFVAQLEDESGISYSGNGIGHDLLLTIDNNTETTYTLNDYYTADLGDYTHGTVAFSIPELEDGEHSLTFRAWDVLNNTSVASLDFVVDNSLKPSILSVTLSNNPASVSTTFLISHDRAGSDCDITIEVFDFSGRMLWRHEETSSSATGLNTVEWNLRSNSGGRLYAGVYLYRVSLRTGESKQVSKSQKLVIAGNK